MKGIELHRAHMGLKVLGLEFNSGRAGSGVSGVRRVTWLEVSGLFIVGHGLLFEEVYMFVKNSQPAVGSVVGRSLQISGQKGMHCTSSMIQRAV